MFEIAHVRRDRVYAGNYRRTPSGMQPGQIRFYTLAKIRESQFRLRKITSRFNPVDEAQPRQNVQSHGSAPALLKQQLQSRFLCQPFGRSSNVAVENPVIPFAKSQPRHQFQRFIQYSILSHFSQEHLIEGAAGPRSVFASPSSICMRFSATDID